MCNALKHPYACFFHMIFKITSILFFVFADRFTESFVMIFIVCALFLSIDFWIVKNISGRLLVGLRWRNEISDEGQSIWLYDSVADRNSLDSTETKIFWFGLLGAPMLWIVFGLLDVISLSFKWLVIPCLALSLSFSNVYGYYKSRSSYYSKIGNESEAHLVSNFTNRVSSRIATNVGKAIISNALSSNVSAQTTDSNGGLSTIDL